MLRHKVKSASFAADSLPGSVDPDVLGLDLVGWLWQVEVLVQQSLVDGRVRRLSQHRARHCAGAANKKAPN